MIVKNEAHIIEDTLTKLLAKIKFDYYVICDTGSTDGTPEIIVKFMENKVPGKVVIHTWKDFGHNRSLALEEAYNTTDYVLIFDADDYIHGNLELHKIINSSQETVDGYFLKFGKQQYFKVIVKKLNILVGTITLYLEERVQEIVILINTYMMHKF